ncbi:MAG TPA: hypothetical protein PLG38_11925 [Propionibacteriaceae bacterium]|nr:hypothetical protein [Propionibacteriaceae bacterium]
MSVPTLPDGLFRDEPPTPVAMEPEATATFVPDFADSPDAPEAPDSPTAPGEPTARDRGDAPAQPTADMALASPTQAPELPGHLFRSPDAPRRALAAPRSLPSSAPVAFAQVVSDDPPAPTAPGTREADLLPSEWTEEEVTDDEDHRQSSASAWLLGILVLLVIASVVATLAWWYAG